MCGIFGIISQKENTVPRVIEGLKKLEYRGYDSWGVSWKEGNKIKAVKKVGKISDFSEKDFSFHEKRAGFSSSGMAIGHSRWATHGKVSKKNTHPHFSTDKKISIVHNGIIENYLEIREELEKKGYKFQTQTDTESVAHLLDQEIKKGLSVKEAFFNVFQKIEGRCAIVCLNEYEDSIVGMRRGSPLILGV